MQEQQSFWETTPSPPTPPVWTALDPAERVEVVSTLARLIEKIAVAPTSSSVATQTQEKNHE
jgi:hypothetical protein